MAEIDAGGLVVIDDPDLAADNLGEPDRGRIADAEVPGGPHQGGRIVGHAGDAAVRFRLAHQGAVIGADHCGIERAFEFLRILRLGQIAPRQHELVLRDEPGLARLEHQGEPVGLGLGAPPQLEKSVAALGGADEHRPALPVSERGTDDLGPDARVHVGIFIEHHAVEIDAAQRIRIVGAEQPHPPAIGIVDAQLRLMHPRPDRARRRHGGAQIVPGHLLGLPQERRQIGEARAQLLAQKRAAMQIVNAGDGFSGAPMGDDAGEALKAKRSWRW